MTLKTTRRTLLLAGTAASATVAMPWIAKGAAEFPARESGAHVAISLEARSIARTIRLWLPQRQRLPASASRICASVGFGFLSSNALADMIIPLMQ